jgi:hypothetical protein
LYDESEEDYAADVTCNDHVPHTSNSAAGAAGAEEVDYDYDTPSEVKELFELLVNAVVAANAAHTFAHNPGHIPRYSLWSTASEDYTDNGQEDSLGRVLGVEEEADDIRIDCLLPSYAAATPTRRTHRKILYNLKLLKVE